MNLTIDTTGFTTGGAEFPIHMDDVGVTMTDTNFPTASFNELPVDTFINAIIRITADPTAVDDSVTVDEDSDSGDAANTFNITNNDSTNVGSVSVNRISDQPDNGTLTDKGGGSYTYVPNADFNGIDTFEYVIRNGNDDPGQEATGTVTITVNPINDPPTIDNPGDTFSIPEDAVNNDSVGQVAATDIDSGAQGTLQYAITSGDPNDAFAIDSNGNITVNTAAEIDHETTPSYTLEVTVTDGGTTPLSDTATFTVNVTDVNENPVVDDQSVDLAENTANNEIVVNVGASDPDSGSNGNLTYEITGSVFSIDANGNIRVANSSALDFEGSPNTFTPTVTVTDGGGLMDTAEIEINLTDVNEAPTANNAMGSVDEGAANTTPVATVNATDPDGTAPNNTLTYAITGGDPDGAFAIDNSGQVTVADGSQIDFEDDSSYLLTVTVTDSGSGMLSDTATVDITVNDVNEAPTANDAMGSVDEGAATSIAVATVDATDPDTTAPNNTLSYAITGGDPDDAFAIDNNGQVTVADGSQIDFEDDSSYLLTVTVTDGGSGMLSDTATVDITVNDVNEAPTANNAMGSVDEGAANTTPVATVNATDPDGTAPNNMLTYAITGGDPDGAFAIDNNGQVTVADGSQIDFEDAASYSLTVTVTDGGTGMLSDTATIDITVNDVNEAPTANNAMGSVDEGAATSTVVATVDATDPDTTAPNNTLSYAITGGDPDGAFTIDNNGQVTVADGSQIDFEDAASYSLTVTVTDGGSNMLSDTATVDITVNDVNEAPTADDAVGTVDEGAATSTVVATVDATDPDTTAPNNTLSYAITGGDPDGAFAIDNNGQVTVADGSQIDFEDAASYSLTVTVTDGGTGMLSDTATVDITVNDVNEAPTITNAVLTFSVAENSPVGTSVFTAMGADPEDDNLTFAIESGNTGGAFQIDSTSGEVTVLTPSAVNDANQPFSLEVSTTDGQFTDTATFTVNVNDVNDPPVANSDMVEVDEDDSIEITLTGNDGDAGSGQQLTFNIETSPTNGNLTDPVSTGLNTATVTYTPNGDFFGDDSFTFTVTDDDSIDGTTLTSDEATIEIDVNSINDAPTAVNDSIAFQDTDASPQNAAAPGVLGNDTDIDSPVGQFSVSAVEGTAGNVGSAITLTNSGAMLTLNANGSYDVDFATGDVGTDTVTYTISDGDTGTDTASLTVTIGAGNIAPTANPDAETTDEDVAVEVDVLDNDTDPNMGDTIGLVDFTQPANGTVTRNDNGTPVDTSDDTVTYSPDANFNGSDSFMYTITDGTTSAMGMVEITINAVPDAPIAVNDSGTTVEDGSVGVPVLLNDSDPDGQSISIDSFTQGTNGSVMQAGNQLIYTPDTNSTANDSFTYTITDGDSTATATVNITVTPVNDAPEANNDSASAVDGSTDNPILVLDNDFDVDGDTLEITNISTPDSGGSVTISDNGTPTDTGDDFLQYTPAAGFGGVETFQYTISDGEGATDTATVVVTVDSNQEPVATDDTVTGIAIDSMNNSIPVSTLLANDQGEAGETLEITSVSAGSEGGTVSFTEGDSEIIYTPAAGFQGRETFTYTLSDNTGPSDSPAGPLTDTATVTLVVGTDPIFFDGDDLVVIGTENSDRIIFSPANAPGSVIVRINNTSFGPFSVPGNGKLTAFGLGGNDTIIAAGRLGNPVNFDGGAANDYLAGSTLDDTMIGGDGNDVILASEGDNYIDGGDGSDRLEGRSGIDTLLGGLGTDRLNGGDGDDYLDSGDGNDFVFGGGGNDLIRGGSGDDNLSGYTGDDIVLGGSGIDSLFGRQGHDVLIGGEGADRVRGNSGDDILIGGSTDYDSNDAALLQILAAWSSGVGIDNRIDNVNSGPNPLIPGDTVNGDSSVDDLTGDTGEDWFFPLDIDFSRDIRSGDVEAS